MNDKKKEKLNDFRKAVIEQVAVFEGKDVESEEVQRLVNVNDSNMIIVRSFYNWDQKPKKEGWSKKKIMDYGAQCTARSIVMNKMKIMD